MKLFRKKVVNEFNLTSPSDMNIDPQDLINLKKHAVQEIEKALKTATKGENYYTHKFKNDYSNDVLNEIKKMYTDIGWTVYVNRNEITLHR